MVPMLPVFGRALRRDGSNMAYAHTYEPTHHLLVVKFWGEVSFEEERSAVSTILLQSGVPTHPGLRILVDRTEASLTATPAEMRKLAAEVERETASVLSPKVACAVSRTVDYGMIRMFEALTEGRIRHRFAVFRSITAAREWLEIPESALSMPGPKPSDEPRHATAVGNESRSVVQEGLSKSS